MPGGSDSASHLSGAAGHAPADSPLTWRRAFPGDKAQLARLRRWVESLLPACPARDDIVAVASELGANALIHTASGRDGGLFVVDITWPATLVRVAVADSGAADGPRVIDDPEREDGRGLMMVRALSARVGVDGDSRGRVVWADIPWPENDRPRLPSLSSASIAPRSFGDVHVSRFRCSCGFAADHAVEYQDHLLGVFIRDDDVGNDGQVHAEVTRGFVIAAGRIPVGALSKHHCACGFAANVTAEFDNHMLLMFTPADSVGRDGEKHAPRKAYHWHEQS